MAIRLDKAVQNKILSDFGVLLSRSYIFKLLEMGAVKYSGEVIKRKGFKFPNEEEASKIILNEDMVKAVIQEYKTGVMSDKYAKMWNNSAPISMFNIRKEFIDKVQVSKEDILYEDENFVAMYKPAGVVSHPSGKDMFEDSMIYRFLKYMKDVHDYMPRAGLVHRLDRETQGILLFAKNMDAYNRVKQQFSSNQVIKLYLVAYLIPKPTVGRSKPILRLLNTEKRDILNLQGKDFFNATFKLPKVLLKGYISMFRFKYKAAFVYQKKELKKNMFKAIKEAISYEYPLYKRDVILQKEMQKLMQNKQGRVEQSRGEQVNVGGTNVSVSTEDTSQNNGKKVEIGFSIMQLLTGRTHQIRAQHEYIGLPVLGDYFYTPSKLRAVTTSIFNYPKAIGLAAIGLSFYDIKDPTKRIYIKLPLEKISFSDLLD